MLADHGSMLAMRLHRRPRSLRTALVLPALAGVLAASAGCSTVVGGKAVIAEPQLGQPVAWGPCRPAGGGGESMPVPAGAQCGKIAVPVDY